MSDIVSQSDVTFDVVAHLIKLLEPLREEDRVHVLNTVTTWYRLPQPSFRKPTVENPRPSAADSSRQAEDPFSGRAEITPKDFLFEKDPRSDLERMAVLAFYLTHFRDTPHFTTNDLSRLNAEAAQRKFTNAASTSSNAMRDGIFVEAPKSGLRQLSAMGERFVQALPDRDAANEAKKRMSSRGGSRRNGNTFAPSKLANVGAA